MEGPAQPSILSPVGEDAGSEAELRAQIARLTGQCEALATRTEAMAAEKARLESTQQVLVREAAELDQAEARMEAEIQAASAQSEDERRLLKRLQKLIKLNETLKSQEAAFKADCQSELARHQAANATLTAQLPERAAEPSGVLTQRQSRLAELRSQVAGRSRAAATLERKLDDVPSSYELAQYQRRFAELDQQMADEFAQTQQFYTLFNTLESQRAFMSREVSMLTSIAEGLPKVGRTSAVQREHFLRQLEALVREVEQSQRSAEDFGREEELGRMKAQSEVNGWLEAQRHYSILVRDFRDAMKRNAALHRQLDSSTPE